MGANCSALYAHKCTETPLFETSSNLIPIEEIIGLRNIAPAHESWIFWLPKMKLHNGFD